MNPSGSNFRPQGAASSANGATDPEVVQDLPPYVPPSCAPRLAVRFSPETMQHPCFWILVGALGVVVIGGIIYYASNRD